MATVKRIQADSTLCRDCQACALACSLYHERECNLGLARLSIAKDMARYQFQIVVCQQCVQPECLAACPAEAMRRDDRGVVLIDDEACIRCGSCAAACPYDAIFYHQGADRYLKCDLCQGREEGPLCTLLCPVGALSEQEVEG